MTAPNELGRDGESAKGHICILPILVHGEITRSDSLTARLLESIENAGLGLQDGDILVVKHKIVSKSENAVVALDDIVPSEPAAAWAKEHGLDPRVSELALRESKRIVRQKGGVLITETRHGFVCANSGVDVSNVDGGQHAVLLPADPDRSAAKLRLTLQQETGVDVAVIVSDSFGRPWREGLTEVAIGVAGMRPMVDYRGRRDAHGYSLHATVDAVADEIACAAGLVCGKLENTPACIIRGYSYQPGDGSAREMIRPAENDLFR